MPEPQSSELLSIKDLENELDLPSSEVTKILDQKELPIICIGKTKRVLSIHLTEVRKRVTKG